MSMKLEYNELLGLYKKMKRLEAELKVAKDAYNVQADKFLKKMDEFGTTSYKNVDGLVSINETKHPQVKDWDALYTYIVDNHAFDLLQRRVGSTAWKERMEDGVEVPGIEEFVKRSIRISLQK